ncbi:SCO7613 C-terminal domain-containing membrane protein [Cellulomonas cellasea]|uniref:Uncharacterized protein n=1 Tax=Cellulomonas cellasea TaxID=43670 RepID=A0A7W4UDD2_9CELL|nr:hypothetical protein [Cellulomonas cellasea]MBB2922094.1 hypothetical protein [Cellulomonas cellasea]
MPLAQGPSPSPDPYAAVRRLLADATACPSCAAALTAARCARCGLDLTGPDARELWSLSQRAVGALDARQAHLAGMRTRQVAVADAQRRAVAAPPVAVPGRAGAVESAAPLPAPAPAGPRLGHSGPSAPPRTTPRRTPAPAGAPAGAGVAGPPPAPVPPPKARPERPHWRVQTVLQVLGASLLAAASIVFLLFSWGWIPLVGRAVAVAVGTVVVFAVASRLRRSGLTSSAEAVGGLAAVLLLLDAWAIPATGLVRPAEPAVYAGVAALVCGGALAVWGVRARLRVGTLSGAVLVPVAPLLLAPLVPSAGGLAGLACTALALTTVRFAGRGSAPDRHAAERVVLAVAAWVLVAVAVLVGSVGALLDGAGWHAPTAPAWGSVAALVAASVLAAVQGRLAATPAADVRPGGAPAPTGTATAPPDAAAGTARAAAEVDAGRARGTLADDVLGSGAVGAEGHGAAAEPSPEPLQPDAAVGGGAGTGAPASQHTVASSGPWTVGTGAGGGAPTSFAGFGGAARAWTTTAGAVASVAALAVVALLARAGVTADAGLWTLVPLAPTLVTLGLRLAHRRRGGAAWAAQGAHAVALLAGVPTVVGLPLVVTAFLVDPGLAPDPATVVALVLGAAATVWLTRAAGRQAQAGSWVAVAVLVAVPVALASVWPGIIGAGLVVLLLALAGLAFAGDAAGVRPVLGTSAPARTVVVVAVLGSLVAAQGALGPLAVALAGTATLSAATRRWIAHPTGLRAAALTAGAMLGWAAAVVALSAAGLDPVLALTATGCALVAGSVLLAVRRGGTAHDRVAWLATGVAALGTAWPWASAASSFDGAGPRRVLLVLLAVLALGGSVAVAVRGRRTVPRSARVAAAVVAPLGALVVVSLERAVGSALPGTSVAVGLAAAGAVGVLLALVLARGAAVDDAPRLGAAADATRHDEHARRAAEAGGWTVLAAALATASSPGRVGSAATAALVLLVAAITAGAWSLAPGRRWARWGTLALATVASWVLLVAGDVGAPEAYLAPAGLVLAVVGARRWRVGADGDVALLGAGLALATVPGALLDGELVAGLPRHAVAGLVAALLVGLAAVPAVGGRPGAGTSTVRPVHVLSLLGALLAVLGPWRHALGAAQQQLTSRSPGEQVLAVEAWSLPAAAVVAAAAWLLARDASAARLRVGAWGPWAVATVAAVPTVVAVSDSGAGLVRTLAALAAGAALALATARRASDPRERADLAAVGLSVAGLGALAGAAALIQPPGDVLAAGFGLLLLTVAVLRAAGCTAPWWGVAGAVLVLPLALQDEVWRGVAAAVLAAALVGAAVVVRRLGASPGAVDGGLRAGADPTPAGSGAFRVALSTPTLLLGTAALLSVLGPARLATTHAGGPGANLHAVEAWALPAAVLLAVALRELTRRTTPVAAVARRTGVWLVAATAAVPTAVAATALATSPLSLGRTLAVLATGAAVAVVGVTGTAPPRRVLGSSLVPLGLAVAGLAWFASAAAPSVPPPAVVLAAVALLVTAVGAAYVARTDPGAGWPYLGALLVLPLVGTPAPWGGPLVGLGVASVALGAGAVLSRAGVAARAGAVPLAVAALLAVAVAARHTADAAGAAPGLRVELVALGSALVLGAGLALLGRRWPFPGPSPRTWGPWPVALAATLPSLAAALDDPADLVRPGVVLGAGSVLAISGAVQVARQVAITSATAPTATSGRAPAARLWGAAATQVRAVGVVLAAGAALLTAVRAGAVPVDAPLVLLGATLLVVGTLGLRSDTRASSWICLAPGLVLAVVVPVVTAWWEPTMWRLVLVLVGATAAVVVGAALRWQAPFVLGTGSLAVVAVVQVSPAAVAAMQVVEWWVVLALGGAVLLGLGLTYERRLREAREAARFVVAMR